MPTDTPQPSPSPASDPDPPGTLEEATRRLDMHREELRGLVKDMDHAVAESEGRRMDREKQQRKGIESMPANEWKLPVEFDERIREWMVAQGWKANSTRDYGEEEVYAWRQDTSSGSSPTLWIARAVIEKHQVSEVIEQLDRSGVADRMRSNPKSRFLVNREAGRLVVNPWPHQSDEA